MADLKNKVICHVTSVHAWNDIRIFRKEATSAAKYFNKAFLVAPNAPNSKVNNVEVVGVPYPISYSRFKRIFFLKNQIIQKALSLDADIYHLHDPELLPAVKLLKSKGKLVIYDSHEDLPKSILSKPWIKFKWIRKVISRLYDAYEKNVCKKCDGVISVLPEITAKFNNNTLATIYNYPLVNDAKERSNTSDKFILIYNGGLTAIRGLSEICAAMNFLSDKFHLKLLGEWESAAFENACMSILKDPSKVSYLGMLDYDTCQNELSKADIGLVMFHKVPNHEVSLPNKSFEYVINQLPMVMSDMDYWKNEFKDCALFADPMQPEQIAEKITEISNNYGQYLQKAVAFRSKVLEEKNWQHEEVKLLDFYKRIVNTELN